MLLFATVCDVCSVAVRVGHRGCAAVAADQAWPDADVQDYAEHCQSRSVHEGTAHAALQRFPQNELRCRTKVCSV